MNILFCTAGLSKEKEEIECNKFYSRFADMSGGIMVFWCAAHGFAVGAHIIPSSEGRNDVFTALYGRWEKPPSVIVYDFACGSALYNMYRAPWFFKNTLHITDTHHSAGHKGCSPTTKMALYRDVPALKHIRDSFAESGNRVLNRIKRSVRYSSLDNSLRLIRMQLTAHNLQRLRRLHNAPPLAKVSWSNDWATVCEQWYSGPVDQPQEQ